MIAEPLVRVRCAVCGGEEHRTVCTPREVAAQLDYLRRFHERRLRQPSSGALADRADFTQDYATAVVSCVDCGLVFRNPRPEARAIARAYAADEYGRERLEALYAVQVELYRHKARRLRRRLPPAARVVEVGSFVGGFLQAGSEAGWEIEGVDPGREVAAFCASRGLRVRGGTLPGLAREGAWKPESLDCVAIWNAFDQLPQPEPVLAAAQRLLRAGGILALRVPNGECFKTAVAQMRGLPRWAGDRLRAALAWNNLLAFPYLNGYSARSLDWMLAWHSFERLDARPDTLARLADDTTRVWAAWEERFLKAGWMAFSRLTGRLAWAPWLDLYYRKALASDR